MIDKFEELDVLNYVLDRTKDTWIYEKVFSRKQIVLAEIKEFEAALNQMYANVD